MVINRKSEMFTSYCLTTDPSYTVLSKYHLFDNNRCGGFAKIYDVDNFRFGLRFEHSHVFTALVIPRKMLSKKQSSLAEFWFLR